MERTVTYISGVPELLRLNKLAEKLRLNRQLEPSGFLTMPPDRRFPIALALDHNGNEMRLMFCADERGTMAFLDVPYSEYHALPTMQIPWPEDDPGHSG